MAFICTIWSYICFICSVICSIMRIVRWSSGPVAGPCAGDGPGSATRSTAVVRPAITLFMGLPPSDGQDRTRRGGDQPGRDAAEKQLGEPRAAMSAEHHQVRARGLAEAG